MARRSAGKTVHAGKQPDGRLDIRSVAAAAGVSISTVSRVMNNKTTVDPLLAKAVNRAVKDLGFVPNRQARSLVSGQSRMFGVLISDITNPFFPELIQGFETAAVGAGYETLLGSTSYDLRKMEACVDRMLESNVDGVAVMTFGMEELLLQRLAANGIPLVSIDVAPATPRSTAIEIDYATGISEAVNHLAALGHECITFIAGPKHVHSALAREKAFRAAMKTAGLPVRAGSIARGDHTLETGRRVAEGLLGGSDCPTAILCSNDMTAIGTMQAIFLAKQKIPEDISLIGFDDVHFAEYLNPPLTTVRMSGSEIARAAVESLIGLLAKDADVAPKRVGTRLIVRQSTAPPRGAKGMVRQTKK